MLGERHCLRAVRDRDLLGKPRIRERLRHRAYAVQRRRRATDLRHDRSQHLRRFPRIRADQIAEHREVVAARELRGLRGEARASDEPQHRRVIDTSQRVAAQT